MAKKTHTKKNVIKKFTYSLTPVEEIAVRNELPVKEVREAYRKCRMAVLKETIQDIRKGKANINYFNFMDRVFSLTEEYLDAKRLKEIHEQEKLYCLNDFSVENGLTYSNVKNIYSRFNSRLFSNPDLNNLERVIDYNPELSQKAFDLTKKYFSIQAHGKLNLR
ncbi:MAG TPA: hypothetical protein PKJ54_02095 [Candidatus Pacearchaeota archaeon]|nr:hypothetical protein [Candidatus Pacearchaeota archaeon]